MVPFALIVALAAGQLASPTGPILSNPGTQRRSSFRQASACGLPALADFPSPVGRALVAPNSADTAEVTRGYMADGSDMGVSAGTGPKECSWTPPGGGDCIRAEVITGTGAAVPRIAAGSVPESLRTLPASDHTMMFVVHPRSTAATRYVFGYGDFLVRGIYVHAGGSGYTACWNGAGAQVCVTAGGGEVRDEVSVVAIRKSGTTYDVFVNGVKGTPATNALAIVNPTTADTLYLGNAYNATTPLNGQFIGWYPASDDWTDDDIKRFSAQVLCSFGSTPQGQSNITNTRAGAAFEVMAAEKENLAKYTPVFANAAWVKQNAGTGSAPTVTDNYGTAPDGTQTAARVQLALNGGTATADQSTVYQVVTVVSGAAYVQGVYVKTNDGSSKTIKFRDDNAGLFDTNFAVTGTWQQISGTGNATTTSSHFRLWLRGSTGTSDSADLLVWHPQMNSGSTLDTYAPTYADQRLRGPFVFPHGDNAAWCFTKGCRSVSAVTNLCLQRRDLSHASWTKEALVTATADSASCPMSRMRDIRMDLTDNTAADSGKGVYQSVTVASSVGPFVAAVDVATASGTATKTVVGICGGGVNVATCACVRDDGATVTPTMVTTNCRCNSTASTTPVRVSVTFTCASAVTAFLTYLSPGQVGTSTGTACYDLAQASTGSAPLPICDNPTQTAAAPCNADVLTVPTSGWPTTEGEISLSYTPNTADATANQMLLDSRTSSTTQGAVIYRTTTERITCETYAAANVCAVQSAVLTFTPGTAKSIECQWTATTCAIVVDGVSVSAAATGSPASHDSAANIGANLSGTTQADGSLILRCVSTPGGCP